MNVSLTPELERYVADKVATGLYQTASEVVRDALRALHDKEARERKLADLRADIDRGWDQCDRGQTQPLDAAGMLAEVRRKKAAGKKKS